MPREIKIVAAQPLLAKDLADLLYYFNALYNVAYFTKFRPEYRVWGRISNNSIPQSDVLSVSGFSSGSILGRFLGTSDAIRKTVTWTKRVLHAEETREKIRAETRRLDAKARKLDAEARKIDAEVRALDLRTLTELIQQLRSAGYSHDGIRQLVEQADWAMLGLKEASKQGLLLGVEEQVPRD